MIYMCGTDLESKYGMGTSDLGEMVKATISDKVNVIVETGGCRAWKNNIVSSSVNQIYQVQTGGLRRLESDFGKSYMTDPDNLASFIQYCTKNFPADRNILIFWDHGGGSLSGYGYDEKQGSGFGVSADTMTLPEIDAALKKGGCVFDWIGFDACLMATLETAMVCNN
ncbi:MAG: peptidase C11, partial [Clostridia bacterium]|nr:peptidase C11 [Clostridia bacterium]